MDFRLFRRLCDQESQVAGAVHCSIEGCWGRGRIVERARRAAMMDNQEVKALVDDYVALTVAALFEEQRTDVDFVWRYLAEDCSKRAIATTAMAARPNGKSRSQHQNIDYGINDLSEPDAIS
jgi:hypothetical protein